MERGIALLHSFVYTEAQQQFAAIAESDPACAMAHWGLAMEQYQPLWTIPDAAALDTGAKEIAKAREIAATQPATTPLELGYIGAIGALYAPASDYSERTTRYVAAMDALHAKFPADIEVAAFDALAILASVQPTDTSLVKERRALAILLPLFAQHPEHPGLAHYIIHTCDTPALAREALPAAREYAAIAPSSAHALHMPGHIFSRLGMWQEDITSNEASVRASQKAIAEHRPGGAHQMHAEEFLIYAYLQTGQTEKARQMLGTIAATGQQMHDMPGMDDMKDDGSFFDAELHAIFGLETHDWKTLATATAPPVTFAGEESYTWWGMGVAAAYLHDVALEKRALLAIDAARERMAQSPFAWEVPSVDIRRNEMRAWLHYLQNEPAEAVTTMRLAADAQDKKGQDEVDIPAREMLGDLLMLEGKPREALAEYQASMKLSPNRLNGWRSAALAAEKSGDANLAEQYRTMASKQSASGV
jgi:tetratricopeptide (TPR) repeat protein